MIGRVGRISFNLIGNVYFVSEEAEKVELDDYVRMLPKQALSIASNPKDKDENNIRKKFKNAQIIPDDDINTSVDQTKRLIMAIKKITSTIQK